MILMCVLGKADTINTVRVNTVFGGREALGGGNLMTKTIR